MRQYTVKSIYETFVKITEKNNLLDLDICGVKIWQYSQFEIFNLLLKKLGAFDHAHSSVNKYQTIKSLPGIVRNILVKNPMVGKGKKEILVFNHPRKMFIDGEYIDIYTQFYLNELDDNRYHVLEKPYMNRHFKNKKSSNIRYLDVLKVKSKVNLFLGTVKLKEDDLRKIKTIEDEIVAEFGCKINLHDLFIKNIKRFKTNFRYYDRLIKRRSPKVIFLVVYYSYMELIHAAKLNGIPVIEIQHGVITPYSISYNFPNRNKKLDYFPDKMIIFGNYWKESFDCPLNENDFISAGFPFLEKQVKKYNMKEKHSNQILFISQGTIGKKLFNTAVDLANKLPNYKVIYKLHPGEYNDWKSKYGYNNFIDNIKNFEIIDNNEKELYSFFAESSIVVGVYSTALYEAMAFDCECILVDLPGIEYMEKLINTGEVYVSKGPDDLSEYIISNRIFNNKKHNYFFNTKCDNAVIKEIINSID